MIADICSVNASRFFDILLDPWRKCDYDHCFDRTDWVRKKDKLLEERIWARTREYMDPDLLKSQIDTLEVPINGLTVDISKSPDEITQIIIDKLVD